jgi:hypothetical protein
LPKEIATFIDQCNYDELETYTACNHCDNGWGLDLCACGSGTEWNLCTNDLPMCNNKMQDIIEGYNRP